MEMQSRTMQTVHRWLIMVAAFITSLINIGVCASFGALFVSISETFGTTRSAAALVQSLQLATMASALIAGFLMEKYRILKTSILATSFIIIGFGAGFFANSIVYIYIFVSAIAGIGTTTMFMCATVAIGLISEGRTKYTALAINSSCIGVGAAIFPYLLNHWESVYGLSGTCLIISALCFNNICFVILLSDISAETKCPNDGYEINRNKAEYRNTALSTRRVINGHLKSVSSRIKSRVVTTFSILYTLTLISSVSVMSTVDAYIVLYVDIYIWKLFSKEQAILSMAPYQIAYITAGLSIGAMKLTKKVNSFAMSLAFTLIGISGTVLLYMSTSWPVAFAGSTLMGVMDGGSWTLVSVIVAELVSEQQYGTAFGLIITVLALFAVAAGPLFALIRDATQSYEVVFLVVGIMQLSSAIIQLKCWLLHRKSPSTTTPKDEPMTCSSTSVADSHLYTSTVTHM